LELLTCHGELYGSPDSLDHSQAVPQSRRYFSQAGPNYKKNPFYGDYSQKDGAKEEHYLPKHGQVFLLAAGMSVI
jgi:hypothetical protein